MYSTHFWYKFSLHRTKVIFSVVSIFLIFSFANTTNAQQKRKKTESTVYNLMSFDKKTFHYGFQIGYISSPVGLDPSDNPYIIIPDENGDPQQALTYITPQTTASFLLGFLMNIKLSQDNHWHFRTSPNVSFYSRRFEIDLLEGGNLDSRDVAQLQSNTTLEVPLLLKYQSDRRKNHRMYLLGGITPSYMVASKHESSRKEYFITLSEFNMSLTWGFGFHIYNSMFCLSPEIRVSHGLINVADKPDNSLIMHTVDAIRTHKISFIINFEG
ncbi:type IX secretion/gliding motility protein PorT/SprT [Flammeovirga pacifica]|uniref:Outer membrane protein beta-barrel domain-containing protein n=1 Tax=Flammeovirga pacifica TaxID=915059 RepID=A0A1S1Z300_FLAPC|nr:outer membrane beta-barrel protein [Flammeovirga pacifica]OHX67650.1 hypothetical protein NH26_15470 [Flammeovirga pacifica]